MAIWYVLTNKRMSSIILGNDVTVWTEHESLKDIHFKCPKGRWISWLYDIFRFSPIVKHISGKDNVVVEL